MKKLILLTILTSMTFAGEPTNTWTVAHNWKIDGKEMVLWKDDAGHAMLRCLAGSGKRLWEYDENGVFKDYRQTPLGYYTAPPEPKPKDPEPLIITDSEWKIVAVIGYNIELRGNYNFITPKTEQTKTVQWSGFTTNMVITNSKFYNRAGKTNNWYNFFNINPGWIEKP